MSTIKRILLPIGAFLLVAIAFYLVPVVIGSFIIMDLKWFNLLSWSGECRGLYVLGVICVGGMVVDRTIHYTMAKEEW